MALTIKQDFEYQGDDRWKWWIWIEGSNEELDRIDRVIYILHPTFANPVRTVTNRTSKFLLRTAGWGTFLIRAKVIDKDGKETLLKHYLELKYPHSTSMTA